MRRFLVAAVCSLALVHGTANAWFFFFIPGSVVGKVSDALTGSEGDQCVAATAKVGDVITSPNGNTATVMSLSGTSSRCQRPEHPIRAALKFNYSFSSEAGMNIPDGFEQKPLTDFHRFNGFLVRAENPTTRAGFAVTARPRTAAASIESVAHAVGAEMGRLVDDFRTHDEEQLSINGMRAVRFEAEGKNKGLFGGRFTYVVTVLEGDKELLVLNAWAPSKPDFASERQHLRELAYSVQGLHSQQTPAPNAPSAPVAPLPVTAPAITEPTPLPARDPAPSADLKRVTNQEQGSAVKPQAETQKPNSVGDRLRELEKLYRDGILTRQEYEEKKKQLLLAL